MKRILVTGSNGYIASLIHQTNKDKYEWILMTRKDADLSDPAAVADFINQQDFDICFHTAANATTAFCEDHPDQAEVVNVEATKVIADICKAKGARLVFCSTEQCFNGKEEAKGPYKEEEPLSAVTVYGQNKIDCEAYIQSHLEDYIILRYSWMMGLSYPGIKASPNPIYNVMHALLTDTPTLFTVNEKRCMTYAKHLADQFPAILELPAGIYHCAAENDKSTYESACYIAKALGASEEQIQKIIVPNHERYKDRFRDYRLDSQKLTDHGIFFGKFEDNVAELLGDFKWLA